MALVRRATASRRRCLPAAPPIATRPGEASSYFADVLPMMPGSFYRAQHVQDASLPETRLHLSMGAPPRGMFHFDCSEMIASEPRARGRCHAITSACAARRVEPMPRAWLALADVSRSAVSASSVEAASAAESVLCFD